MEEAQSALIDRTRFFKAALELCAAKGYHAIRDEEIAECAGYSIETFDQYFKGKRDLFLNLFEHLLSDLQEKISQALINCESATQALRCLFQTLPEWSSSHPGLATHATTDMFWLASQDVGFRLVLMGYYNMVIKEAAQLIKWGITYGEFDPSLEPQKTARLLFTAVDGLQLLNSVLKQDPIGNKAGENLFEVLLSAFRHNQSREQDDENNPRRVTKGRSLTPIENQ
jgi:AcrR family transcriptional regulator